VQYFSKLFGKTSMRFERGDYRALFSSCHTTGERLSLQEALTHGPVLLAFFKVSLPHLPSPSFLATTFAQMQEQACKFGQ